MSVRPRRSPSLALLTALLALAGATQALAPASASAMTEQQRQKAFCETVAYILNDPGLCAAESKSGSGGGDGGIRYGATEPWPGVIDIVAPKPREERSVNCGFGIHAARQVDCPRRPGRDGGAQRIEGSGRGPVGAQGVGSKRPGGRHPGNLAKCVFAKELKALKETRTQELTDLRYRLEGRDNFDDSTGRARLSSLLEEAEGLASESDWYRVFKKVHPTLWGPFSHRELIGRLQHLWVEIAESAKMTSGSLDCLKVTTTKAP